MLYSLVFSLLMVFPFPSTLQTDEKAPAEEAPAKSRADAGPYSVELPEGWKLEKLQGIDSLMHKITDGQAEVYCDYGRMSGPHTVTEETHYVEEIVIDGYKARIVTPKGIKESSPDSKIIGVTGAYITGLGEKGECSLNITAQDLRADQMAALKRIISSLQFKK